VITVRAGIAPFWTDLNGDDGNVDPSGLSVGAENDTGTVGDNCEYLPLPRMG
jgi:hypothetical protein